MEELSALIQVEPQDELHHLTRQAHLCHNIAEKNFLSSYWAGKAQPVCHAPGCRDTKISHRHGALNS